MKYTGSRVDGAEYFDDIVDQHEDAGVFQGLGAEDYEETKETVTADGLKVSMNCRVCGRRHDVTLEWRELYLVGANGPSLPLLKPQGWDYSPNNGKLFPVTVHCAKCSNLLCPQVTPDEARNRVNDAISQGLLPREQAQQWAAQVAQYRGGG